MKNFYALLLASMLATAGSFAVTPSGSPVTIRGAVTPGQITEWKSRTEIGSSGATIAGISTLAQSAYDTLASVRTNAQAYGSVYIHDGTNTIAITATNYTEVCCWQIDTPQSMADPVNVTVMTNGLRVLSDGVYSVSQFISAAGPASATVESALFVDDVHQDGLEWDRKFPVGGVDIGAASAGQLIYLTSNQVVNVKLQATDAGNFIINQGQLVLHKVGQTIQELPIVQTLAGDETNAVASVNALNNGLDTKATITNVMVISAGEGIQFFHEGAAYTNSPFEIYNSGYYTGNPVTPGSQTDTLMQIPTSFGRYMYSMFQGWNMRLDTNGHWRQVKPDWHMQGLELGAEGLSFHMVKGANLTNINYSTGLHMAAAYRPGVPHGIPTMSPLRRLSWNAPVHQEKLPLIYVYKTHATNDDLSGFWDITAPGITHAALSATNIPTSGSVAYRTWVNTNLSQFVRYDRARGVSSETDTGDGVQLAVQDNDEVIRHEYRVYDGTNYQATAEEVVRSTGGLEQEIVFRAGASTNAMVDALTITKSGASVVGTLSVVGNVTVSGSMGQVPQILRDTPVLTNHWQTLVISNGWNGTKWSGIPSYFVHPDRVDLGSNYYSFSDSVPISGWSNLTIGVNAGLPLVNYGATNFYIPTWGQTNVLAIQTNLLFQPSRIETNGEYALFYNSTNYVTLGRPVEYVHKTGKFDIQVRVFLNDATRSQRILNNYFGSAGAYGFLLDNVSPNIRFYVGPGATNLALTRPSQTGWNTIRAYGADGTNVVLTVNGSSVTGQYATALGSTNTSAAPLGLGWGGVGDVGNILNGLISDVKISVVP